MALKRTQIDEIVLIPCPSTLLSLKKAISSKIIYKLNWLSYITFALIYLNLKIYSSKKILFKNILK